MSEATLTGQKSISYERNLKMYLTIYTKPKDREYTFEDLLKDPFLSFENIPMLPQKKVTTEITEEYGRELFNKKYQGDNLPDMTWTDSIITEENYTHWHIPKSNGGRRHICGPSETLKAAQAIYKQYIEETLHVLNHKCAHAYTKNRSIVTNAKAHLNNKSLWSLKIDFSNFFESINAEWLKKMLLQVYPFKFIPEEHLNRLIKLSLLDQVLPQGSKLSPTLTNIIMVPIDNEICETLHNYKRHHYVYTRYADDICISCKQKFNPQEILKIVRDIMDKWETPFQINPLKTRFSSANGPNYICGININYNKQKDELKLTAGHEKNNKFRAMLHNFCLVGEDWDIKDIQKMLGLISYYKSFEKDFVERTISKYNEKHSTDIMAKAKYLLNNTNFTVVQEQIIPENDSDELPF